MTVNTVECQIDSGCIEINITQNQDTAVPFPYHRSRRKKWQCRFLAYHSGTAKIDISSIALGEITGWNS